VALSFGMRVTCAVLPRASGLSARGLWARTNLLQRDPRGNPAPRGFGPLGRPSQVLVRSARAFCYASVSVRDASVRGKGRSPPEQFFHLRTFFQPGVRTSGMSMKGGRYVDRIN
jgi:hypothetical protein